MDLPPLCPHCPDRRALWRDTTHTVPSQPHRWVWFCAGCRRTWEPTPEQKRTWEPTPEQKASHRHAGAHVRT
ncbi:hypothetical protein CG717_03255 [Streptomyces sp. CB02613]|nr:hypothetical protein CG717_03255 [Streptomyces sp. CB02613]